jgi:L-2-hydroxyglutarate oxidase LhgO
MLKAEAIVIGAGVVGLALARALALRGLEVLLLEQESAIGTGTSARSSEVIHAGIYYEPGSLKAEFCVQGRRALYAYCESRHIPHRRCGKLIVATGGSECAALEALLAQARANGVDDAELLVGAALRALEPELRAKAALLSPSSGIVDSHALMQALLADLETAGGNVVLRTKVVSGALGADSILLRTEGEETAEIEARIVVNAAGLGAWDLSASLQGLDHATVPPNYLAKGSYFSLSGVRAPFRHLIYPLPEPGGLGVHLTLDLAGQARFGPDVEWVETIDYGVEPARAAAFYAAIRRYWPGLPDGALEPAYCGIRPKTTGPGEPSGDFIIQGPEVTGHPGYVALYGIDSPGLTSSLAIAEHVAGRLR